MNLYLDDVRNPPAGNEWTVCRTVAEAMAVMLSGPVEYMSLDHDLDVCPICHPDEQGGATIAAPCVHATTGYDFVKWMADMRRWPRHKPMVHSANPVGAHAMRQMIDKFWEAP